LSKYLFKSSMNNVKTMARFLFYSTRIVAYLYAAIALHSGIALVTRWSFRTSENGRHFQILFPFTPTAILNGDNNLHYTLFEFLIPLSLYSLFFFWLSSVFKVFFQPKLFTENAIYRLNRFYLANFIAPGLMLVIVSITDHFEAEALVLVMLHAVIGIFAYFLAAIFKKGVNLQKEQDLII